MTGPPADVGQSRRTDGRALGVGECNGSVRRGLASRSSFVGLSAHSLLDSRVQHGKRARHPPSLLPPLRPPSAAVSLFILHT